MKQESNPKISGKKAEETPHSRRMLFLANLPNLQNAACKGMTTNTEDDIFFGPHVCGPECDGPRGCYIAKSEKGRYKRIEKAKALCDSCLDKGACLEWALETKQPYGIWGGTTERERREILKKRRQEKKLAEKEQGNDG